MRVMVRDLPPYVVGATRYLVAGPIMLAFCALRAENPPTRHDLRRLLVISDFSALHRQHWACCGARYMFPADWLSLIVAIGAHLGGDH